MAKLKIALVADHFLPEVGGIEVHVSELAKRLAAAGHGVQVWTACPRSEPFHGIPVRIIPGTLIPGSEVFILPGFRRELRKLLAQENLDVVHCHSSIFSPLAYSTAQLCQQLKIPAVLTNHSLFSTGSTLTFRLAGAWLRWADWNVVFSAVSAPAQRRLAKAFVGKQIQILPNGIEPEFWAAPKKPRPYSRIVSVGRLHRKKSPDALIQAIPLVNARVAPLRPLFTLVGDGPEKFKLQALARKLRVERQVEFTGTLPREKIREIFASSDIFALASSWETHPISILEACAAGLPVVAMNRGGVPDIVEHEKQGLLADSPESFAANLTRLIQDPAMRENLGNQALERSRYFSWENILPQNLQLYDLAIQALAPAVAAETFMNKEAI